MRIFKKEKKRGVISPPQCPNCRYLLDRPHALKCPRCMETLSPPHGCTGCGRCGRG